MSKRQHQLKQHQAKVISNNEFRYRNYIIAESSQSQNNPKANFKWEIWGYNPRYSPTQHHNRKIFIDYAATIDDAVKLVDALHTDN